MKEITAQEADALVAEMRSAIYTALTQKHHFLIRVNTHHQGSDLKWCLIQDGFEHLVRDVRIQVPVYTEVTIENGEEKYNIACDGTLWMYQDEVAHIR